MTDCSGLTEFFVLSYSFKKQKNTAQGERELNIRRVKKPPTIDKKMKIISIQNS